MAACAGVAFACHAEDQNTADAVSYYFQDLAPLLKIMYADVREVELCMRRYKENCSAWQDVDDFTARKVIDYVRLVADPDVAGLPPPKEPASLEEMLQRLDEHRTSFLEKAKPSELKLFVRVEAVNRVCPEEKSGLRLAVLGRGLEVNYTRFWQESAEDYARTHAAFEHDAAEQEAIIRKEWTKKRCAKTLEVGRDVLAQLQHKTRPNFDDADLVPTDRYRGSLTFTTFWRIALGLKSETDPSIVEKVHRIEKR